MRIILSFNLKFYREKIRLQNFIFKKIGRLKILFIQFTLNSYNIGNIFIVKLAGEDVILNNIGIKLYLFKLILKNLSLVAQYFYIIITAFFNCFFKCLFKEAGIFSTISSYFKIVELITQIILYLYRFAKLFKNFSIINLSKRLVSNSQF